MREREELQSVCSQDEAIKECRDQAERSTQATQNISVKESILERSLQNCRTLCNADSQLVKDKYLKGCSDSTRNLVKISMDRILNRCGSYSRTDDTDDEVLDTSTAANNPMIDYLTTTEHYEDFSKLRCVGLCTPSNRSVLPNGTVISTVKLSRDMRYVQEVTLNGSQTSYFVGGDGLRYSNYNAAVDSVARAARGPRTAPTAPVPDSPGGESFHNPEGAAPKNAEPATVGREAGTAQDEDEVIAGSVRPSKRPESEAPAPTTSPRSPAPSDTASQAAAPRPNNTIPVAQPQPLLQTASAPGAILENALNSPPVSSEVTSGTRVASMSPYSMSEATSSGGYSDGGGGSSFSGSGYNMPSPGNNNLNVPSTADPQAAVSPSSVSPSLPMGSGGGMASMGLPFAEGRRGGGNRGVSASRGIPGFRSESFRYDSFYKGSGGLPVAATRSRVVPVDPHCRPTRTKRCAMKRVAVGGTSQQLASVQCDGKPECILRLTGKLQMPRVRALNGNRESSGMDGGDQGDRGIASVPKEGGVWRGYKNILLHIDNLGKDYLQLDHEGFLVTDDLQ